MSSRELASTQEETMPVFKSASSSPWLCALLPLWLVACGPGEEDMPSNEPSSLATQRSPVDMPLEDDECHEWTREYTTTSSERQVLGTWTAQGFPVCWVCVNYNDCTVTRTWRESYVCMGPTVEGAVLEVHQLSESWSCDPTLQSDCGFRLFC
ncbi:hypothetical protein JRI60_00880 [Archangium violaceum]|uniref:hypothetical protein n=1 Tax=Archangium violaceum TaxID=83451 RepID=UPI001951A8CD|nr:hypothetical protein [Archangium violaceum]QRN97676.1 hypothetical protein JRI60_00880 [Archangium violaceum]